MPKILYIYIIYIIIKDLIKNCDVLTCMHTNSHSCTQTKISLLIANWNNDTSFQNVLQGGSKMFSNSHSQHTQSN